MSVFILSSSCIISFVGIALCLGFSPSGALFKPNVYIILLTYMVECSCQSVSSADGYMCFFCLFVFVFFIWLVAKWMVLSFLSSVDGFKAEGTPQI